VGAARRRLATEPPWSLTTWRGWQHFAATNPTTPPQPGQVPRSVEERLAYRSAFVTTRDPVIHALAAQVSAP
jgi:hypothetical protein